MSGYIFLWILLGIAVINANRIFQLRTQNIFVQNLLPEEIEEVNIYSSQVNNQSYVSGLIRLKRPVAQLEIKWIIDLIKINNQTMRLINTRFDGCNFLRGVHKSTFLNMFLKTMQKHVNTDVHCPFKPSFNYTLNNWTLHEENFPGYVPECQHRGLVEVYIKNQKAVLLKYTAKIVRN